MLLIISATTFDPFEVLYTLAPVLTEVILLFILEMVDPIELELSILLYEMPVAL